LLVVRLTGHGDRTWQQIYTPLVFVAGVTHTIPALTVYVNWWYDVARHLSPKERLE